MNPHSQSNVAKDTVTLQKNLCTFAKTTSAQPLGYTVSPVGGAKHANSNRLGRKDYTCPM